MRPDAQDPLAIGHEHNRRVVSQQHTHYGAVGAPHDHAAVRAARHNLRCTVILYCLHSACGRARLHARFLDFGKVDRRLHMLVNDAPKHLYWGQGQINLE